MSPALSSALVCPCGLSFLQAVNTKLLRCTGVYADTKGNSLTQDNYKLGQICMFIQLLDSPLRNNNFCDTLICFWCERNGTLCPNDYIVYRCNYIKCLYIGYNITTLYTYHNIIISRQPSSSRYRFCTVVLTF